MKRHSIRILTALLLILLIPLALLAASFLIPLQFDESYYGELSEMYAKSDTPGRKVFLVGGSSVAFGVDLDYLERVTGDYTVCPFGLYGTLGTKYMLDLSETRVGPGDIVLVMPEPDRRMFSLNFDGKEVLRAADGDPALLGVVKSENWGDLAAAWPEHLAEKLSFSKKGKPTGEGAYTKASFDARCQMTYDRPYNVMAGMMDRDNMVGFSADLLDPAFISYLNGYAERCESKGAQVYFTFCPVDRLAVADPQAAEGFYEALSDALSFPVLGSLDRSVMDADWFYDSNFHLNTAGSKAYTIGLIDALKLALDDPSPTRLELPEKPISVTSLTEGNNEDAAFFTYEALDGYINLTGLAEEGRRREALTVPASYDGLPVLTFDAEVFQGDVFLRELTIPACVRTIHDYSFLGCTNLERVNMEAADPVCAVGSHLLEGAGKVKLVLPDYESYTEYAVNYYWSQYAARLSYE